MASGNRRKRGASCRELPAAWSTDAVGRAERATAKVRSENHGTGRAGAATVKTVVLIRASVSRAA
eukprot:5653436-Pleurochrysis_carterae.AAC.1